MYGLGPVPFQDGCSVSSTVAAIRVRVCFCSPARVGRYGVGQIEKVAWVSHGGFRRHCSWFLLATGSSILFCHEQTGARWEMSILRSDSGSRGRDAPFISMQPTGRRTLVSWSELSHRD